MEKNNLFFMVDDSEETKSKIEKGLWHPHCLYGAISFEKKGKAKIVELSLKNVFKLKKNSIVIINRLKYAFILKILGVKIILIDMNSNHDFTMYKGLKNKLIYFYNKINYRLPDYVICLSKIQVKKLREIGAKKILVSPLGVDYNLIKGIKTIPGDYYLSSGLDSGRDFSLIQNLKEFNIKILNRRNRLSYKDYLKVFGGCKALILNIRDKKGTSDLSGTSTCFEALLMRKVIFINKLPWLKELLKENYYVYKDEEDLRKLLRKNIKFKKISYDYLKLKKFEEKIDFIINKITLDLKK